MLLHIPIAKGQTVYEIRQDCTARKSYILENTVTEVSDFRIWGNGIYWEYKEIGSTLFLNKEDAEEKIREDEEMGNRLTWEKDGEWGLKNYDIKKVTPEIYGALCKLHEYEKSGLSPERVMELSGMVEEIQENTDHPCSRDDPEDAAVRETWIKQHTCDFCQGRNMHTCTSYSCKEPKQKAADYYDREIRKVLT